MSGLGESRLEARRRGRDGRRRRVVDITSTNVTVVLLTEGDGVVF